MINMIRADFYRVLRGKTLKICLLLTAGWVFLCSYAQQATADIRETITGGEVVIDYWDSFFNYYPVILPIIIFCTYFASADFRQGTIKVYIAKGVSRWKYFFSKLIIGWLASFLFLLIAFCVGMGCSQFFFGTLFDSTFSGWNFIAYLLCQLLFHAAVTTMAIAITFWVRNSIASMAINFCLVFFGYLVLHTIESLLGMNYAITLFWAFSNISKTRIDLATQWLPTAILVFVGYLVVLGIISVIHLNRRDVA